jgi:hypothetical protein
MRVARMVWSPLGLVIILLVGMIPVYWPLLPVLSGTLFPVTSKVEFVDVHEVDGGLSVRLKFEKRLDCAYVGAVVDENGLPIDFYPMSGGTPISLPTGERVSRPWFVGATDLKDIRLRWVHSCNPFFQTVTVGYP